MYDHKCNILLTIFCSGMIYQYITLTVIWIFFFFFFFKHIFIDELHITFFFTIQYNIGFRNKRNAYINPFPKFPNFSLISPQDIVSNNELTLILKIDLSVRHQTHYDITDKNNDISFESLDLHTLSLVSQLVYWTRCNTSNNVCFNLHNCRYSIYKSEAKTKIYYFVNVTVRYIFFLYKWEQNMTICLLYILTL